MDDSHESETPVGILFCHPFQQLMDHMPEDVEAQHDSDEVEDLAEDGEDDIALVNSGLEDA